MSDIVRDVELRLQVLIEETEATIARWGPALEAGRDRLREVALALASFRDQHGAQRAIEVELTRARSALEAARAGFDEHERASERATLAELLAFLAELRQLAIDRLSVQVKEHAAPDVSFMASRGGPRLHWGLVVPLPQVIPMDPPWDDDDDDDGEKADAAPADSVVRLGPSIAEPPSPEVAERAALARDAMEDLAGLGTLRTLYDHEPWGQAEAFEQRLLLAYDYLVSLERPYAESLGVPSAPKHPRLNVVERLYRYATDFAVPDTGRSFALAFVLSSVGPSVARSWLSISIRRAHDRCLAAYVDAMSLGASEEVNDVCRALLAEGARVELMTATLVVLRRRKQLDQPLLIALAAHPDARVVSRAARGLVRTSVDVSAPVLARLLDGPEEVAAAALESLAVLGAQMVPAFAREAASGDGVLGLRALEILAFSGAARDRDLLLERALANSSLLPWVARVGWVVHAERLAEAHEVETKLDRRAALDRALTTMLGPFGASARAKLRELALPRDGRVRGGKVFGGADALISVLRDRQSSQGDRRWLARELSVLKRAPMPFDIDGWTWAQRAALGG